jgi:hypothetical protein
MKKISLNSTAGPITFLEIPLVFEDAVTTNIWKAKNNKKVSETLTHHRYSKFRSMILRNYAQFLDVPLGEFLFTLKNNEDTLYKQFLNKYGDLKYSVFKLSRKEHEILKGVYIYTDGAELLYIGRCTDSLKKRINYGYGKIHPKNCYIDGQSTNCRLNALITELKNKPALFLYAMDNKKEIEFLESNLRMELNPPWNLV